MSKQRTRSSGAQSNSSSGKNTNNVLWYERVSELRDIAREQPHQAGIEALRLFEDWLYENARDLGFGRDHGGMGEYIPFLEKRGRLSRADGARGRRFADIRNCLAHRSGLLMSPQLVEELLFFIENLFRSGAMDAEHLMTPEPHFVQESDSLLEARDWMLENDVSRLPVTRDGQVVGLLTNRDLLLAESRGEAADTLTVGDALHADSLEKIVFLPPRAPYDQVLSHLQQDDVAAILVTQSGRKEDTLLGVITITDLLPKL